jgi:thiamine pyrophosphate-dependent acetolactate synthase large subunit-like protein
MKKTLSLLLDRVMEKNNSNWINRINEARKTWFDNLIKKELNNSQALMPQLIIKAISENIRENEIITLDSGDNII